MCQRYGRGRSRLEVEDHLQATAYYFLHEQNFYAESINNFYVIVKRQLKVCTFGPNLKGFVGLGQS